MFKLKCMLLFELHVHCNSHMVKQLWEIPLFSVELDCLEIPFQRFLKEQWICMSSERSGSESGPLNL